MEDEHTQHLEQIYAEQKKARLVLHFILLRIDRLQSHVTLLEGYLSALRQDAGYDAEGLNKNAKEFFTGHFKKETAETNQWLFDNDLIVAPENPDRA